MSKADTPRTAEEIADHFFASPELQRKLSEALIAFGADEYAKGAIDQQKRCEEHKNQARRSVLEQAAEIANKHADSTGSSIYEEIRSLIDPEKK